MPAQWQHGSRCRAEVEAFRDTDHRRTGPTKRVFHQAVTVHCLPLSPIRCGHHSNKSRDVPISPCTSDALRAYLTDWGCYFPYAQAALTTTAGTRLRPSNLGTVFAEVVAVAGLKAAPHGQPPRLRGLRHSFAVGTLRDFYDSGCDVAALLPVLSAYIRHVSPASTYWYLSAAPDLLGAAARRAQSATGGQQ